MASERHKLDINVNDSKNTRMDIVKSLSLMDFRKDELMHIGRYLNACQTAIDLAKVLKRGLKVLDLGCGEIYIPRTLYKSFVVKKSDVVAKYYGVDIENDMLEQVKNEHKNVVKAVNAKLITQDLTVDPIIKLSSNSVDLVVWFENIEHIKPKFVKSILSEIERVIHKDSIVLISTPNADGSNNKLPKDHIYEWGYEELYSEISKYLYIDKTTGTCINVSKIPKEILNKRSKVIENIYNSFGRNTAMSSCCIAPLIPAKYCKNVVWKCSKRKETL